ncbi:hypothetical protein AB3N59_09325 [Leptospira sp. WS92.C1]
MTDSKETMRNRIQFSRSGTSNQTPLILVPDFDFSGRILNGNSFVSEFRVNVLELRIDPFQIDFPNYEEWIRLLCVEIENSERKVRLLGEGLFSGMIFDLLKRYPDQIESACLINPPFLKTETASPIFPQNVEWILERFPWHPWFLLSKELHSLLESMKENLLVWKSDFPILPSILFTKNSGNISDTFRILGKQLSRYRVFRIEAEDAHSIQALFQNLVTKILAEVPISSVQKKSNFKMEPGF